MSKAIDKEYLLHTLEDYEDDVIDPNYQKKLTAGNGIDINGTTNTISTPFTIVNGQLCYVYYKEED